MWLTYNLLWSESLIIFENLKQDFFQSSRLCKRRIATTDKKIRQNSNIIKFILLIIGSLCHSCYPQEQA